MMQGFLGSGLIGISRYWARSQSVGINSDKIRVQSFTDIKAYSQIFSNLFCLKLQL
jgi:hypothetical protein